MKIAIFGSNGMLGNYVLKILSKNYIVKAITRDEYDIEKDEDFKLYDILNILNSDYVIINCAGAIPQRVNDFKKFIKLNSIFPHKLSQFCYFKNIKFIHVTTDCVFNGEIGNYNENSEHTERGIYGLSKSLGEPSYGTIIRTSIIGHETNNKKSLLEWVLSKKNQTINGYTNHLWNGVTCLELALFIKYIIENNNFWSGIRHIFSPKNITKFTLCKYINEIYNLNINITPFSEGSIVNKTLSTIYKPIYSFDDIYIQIQKMKNFNESSDLKIS
jgi:dTDP-4-dehydrorhamnose reductase